MTCLIYNMLLSFRVIFPVSRKTVLSRCLTMIGCQFKSRYLELNFRQIYSLKSSTWNYCLKQVDSVWISLNLLFVLFPAETPAVCKGPASKIKHSRALCLAKYIEFHQEKHTEHERFVVYWTRSFYIFGLSLIWGVLHADGRKERK